MVSDGDHSSKHLQARWIIAASFVSVSVFMLVLWTGPWLHPIKTRKLVWEQRQACEWFESVVAVHRKLLCTCIQLKSEYKSDQLEKFRLCFFKECPSSERMCANISFPLTDLPQTCSCPSDGHARGAAARTRKKGKGTQKLMAALPAAWGLTHKNTMKEDGQERRCPEILLEKRCGLIVRRGIRSQKWKYNKKGQEEWILFEEKMIKDYRGGEL